MKKFNVILAVDLNNGIGINGTIPWKNRLDMDYFRYITSYTSSGDKKKNLLVFGNRTKHRIENDPKRDVFVLSGQNNLSKVLAISDNYDKIFICGGDTTYKNFYNFAYEKSIDYRIYKNFIDAKYDVDTIHRSSPLLEDYNKKNLLYLDGVYFTVSDYIAKERKYIQLSLSTKTEILSDPYINLLHKIVDISNSEKERQTRNAKTYSGFGETLRFSLSQGIGSLLPAKTLFYRGVIEELLFFLRGHTDTKLLEEKKINIWKPNTEKTNGDMGPMYGYQLRNFGGHGYDQLDKVIQSLKNDPYSRRHIMTMFNPEQAELGVLYPCHGIVIQFYVGNDDRLSLMMYQRSADIFLGLPFNIFSYGVLLLLICKEINREPGDLIISLGDYHLYESHKSKAELQLALHMVYILDREHSPEPTLNISDRVSLSENIYEYSDFKLENYYPMGTISAEMYA